MRTMRLLTPVRLCLPSGPLAETNSTGAMLSSRSIVLIGASLNVGFGIKYSLAVTPSRVSISPVDRRSIGTAAFNGYSTGGIVPNKKNTAMFAADVIFHF